jgi:hypothetical protein
MCLCVDEKRGMLVTSTLRVSEKRRPSCKDMPSVTEAESWSSWVWVWEETDDGDIATASMGKQDGSAPSPVAKIDSSSQHQEQQNPSPQPCWGTKTPQESRELLKEEEETTKLQSLGLAAVAHL